MNTNKDIINRDKLHFADEVIMRFTFLTTLGFQCVSSGETFVEFESSILSVNVYHGQQSYEIGLDIVFLISKEGYSISQVLELKRYSKIGAWSFPTVTSRKDMVDCVNKLADHFHKCIDIGLLTDKGLLSELRQQVEDWCVRYARDVELSQAHESAIIAWREQKYRSFIDILDPLKEYLSLVDLQKLEYAKKKIDS